MRRIVFGMILAGAAWLVTAGVDAAECHQGNSKVLYEMVPNVVIPDTIAYKPTAKSQSNPANLGMSSNYPASYIPYLPTQTPQQPLPQALPPLPQPLPTVPDVSSCEGTSQREQATSIQQTASTAWSFSSPVFKVASVPTPAIGAQNSGISQTSRLGSTQINVPPGIYEAPLPYHQCPYGTQCGSMPTHQCGVRAAIANHVQQKQAKQQALAELQLQQWQQLQQQQQMGMPQMQQPMQQPMQQMPMMQQPQPMQQPMQQMPMMQQPQAMQQPMQPPVGYTATPVMTPYGMAMMMQPIPQPAPVTAPENGTVSGAVQVSEQLMVQQQMQQQQMQQPMMMQPMMQQPYMAAPSSSLSPYDVALLVALLKNNSRRDAMKDRRDERRGSAAASTDPVSMLMEAWATPMAPTGVTARMPSKTAYPWGYFGAQSSPQQTANFGGYYNNSFGTTTQPGM